MPVGILLSGGLGLVVVVALLPPRKADTGSPRFSIGFDDVGRRSSDDFEVLGPASPREFGTDHRQLVIGRRAAASDVLPQRDRRR